MSWDCRERKYGNNKKYQKAVNLDSNEDDLVLCSLSTENKKENVKKKFGLQKMLNSPLRLE